jgi:ribosomal protein S18 acetylase RimI-like enzyme
MTIRQIDDTDDLDVSSLRIENLIIRGIAESGELLDAAYDLLLREFKPSVVDSKEVYIDAVTDQTNAFRDFPPIFFAAILPDGENEWLAGFLSSDLMLFGKSNEKVHLSIGNITTSPQLRKLRFRGVGTTLWQASLRAAEQHAQRAAKRLICATSEAEPKSLQFWAKIGFRWPEGVKYFQPPLEFDDEGNPRRREVPETFLLHPLGSPEGVIDSTELQEIIRDIYWNWGLRPSVNKLSAAAMSRAKEYVMGRVLSKTLKSLPDHGAIPLVDVPAEPVH